MGDSRRPTRPGPAGAPDDNETLRRLRLIAIAAPVVFLVTLEAVRMFILGDSVSSFAHGVAGIAMTVAAVAFAVVMFRLIGRSHDLLRRSNRDLGAVTSLSGALRGAITVDDAVAAGVAETLDWTGAVEATVTVLPSRLGDRPDKFHHRREGDPQPPDEGAVERVVEIPLATPAETIGHLDLRFPDGASSDARLGEEALRSLGEHLACSIRVAQLVEELHRSRREERGLYELLLGISGGEPLGETLAATACQARVLLCADAAGVHLEDGVTATLLPRDAAGGAHALADGTVTVLPPLGDTAAAARPSGAETETLTSVIRGASGLLGEIWVLRAGGEPVTPGDRRLLSSLCELASLAVTTAQARGNEAQAAAVAERERLAREMHDGLAQALAVIHLRLRQLCGSPDLAPTPVGGELRDLAEIAEDAYRDVREALLGLRESSRTDRGLVEGLQVYLDKFSHQSGIATRLEAGPAGEPSLSRQTETQVTRVLQEALANARKHSGARSAVVRVIEDETSVTFVVEDDGHGFSPDDLPDGREGFGLQAMRERMALVGGTLSITSAPGRGTRVVADCPRHANGSAARGAPG